MLRQRQLTPDQRYVMRKTGAHRWRGTGFNQKPGGLTRIEDPDWDSLATGWSEIVGVALASFFITIGIGGIAIVLWLFFTVVAFPTELAPPAPWMPDPTLTPGKVDAAIDQGNIATTICAKSYRTGTVRPDTEYTNALKTSQLEWPEYSDRTRSHYEEDHLIPLELGGHPSDPKNLWPEYWNGRCGAHVKDKLENQLHDLVCAHKIGLAEARGEIATDWVRAYNAHVGPLECP